MAWPSSSARTKNWGTEILTDTDLESELDLLHSYINDMMNSSTGHKHDGTTAEGPKILTANIDDSAGTAGDVFYSSGTALTRLAIGTAGQALVVNSGATAVEWGEGTTFASAAEVKTGTESAKAIAPDTFVSHEGAVKGWIRFNGSGTIATDDSYNVSGIVDNGTGDYTVTWNTDFATANYAVVGTAKQSGASFCNLVHKTLAAGSFRMETLNTAGSAADSDIVTVIAIGDR